MFKKAMFKKANKVSRKNWWLRIPHPRQGLYTRNFNGRNYRFYRSWRTSWRPLFAENSIASGCSAPWAPGRGSAPRPHPYAWGARCALRHARCASAHGNFPPSPPPFLEILDPPLLLYVWKIDPKILRSQKKGSDSPRSSAFGRRTEKKKKKNAPPPHGLGRIDAHADECPLICR